MDPNLYKAAMKGNVHIRNYLTQLETQLTPNRNTALHVAAMFGKTLCVNEILENCPSSLLTRPNIKGETPLHLAAKEGYSGVVLALIECAKELGEKENGKSGADQIVMDMLRKTNDDEDTALHEAVRYRHLDVVKLLVSNDPEFLHQRNKDNETPLYLAVEKGLDDFVSVILNTCKSTSPGGPEDTTALHMAVIMDDEGSVNKLLDWKADLSQEGDENGWTPLHYAAHLNRVKRARQLLDLDKSSLLAYITAQQDHNNTALHIAASQGNKEFIELLLSRFPDCFEMANSKGQNIILIAIENKKNSVIRYMKSRYGDCFDILVNQKDSDGNTPLHLVSAQGSLLPEILLHPRVEKMSFNKESFTPVDICNEGSLKSQRVLWIEPHVAKLVDTINPFTATKSIRYWKKSFGPKSERKLLTRYKEKRETRKRVRVEESDELKKARDINLIVASLIATVAFAASFTVPGGYNDNNGPNEGMAILTSKVAFQAFVIADTIAMMFSSIAVLLYFLTTTTRYSLSRTYRKANVLTLLGLGAMMLAFVTGLYAVLLHSSTLAISACVIGSIFLFFYYRRAGMASVVLSGFDD